MNNLNKYILYIQLNLCDTVIPHSTTLTEPYKLLHRSTEHVLLNCAIILTKIPTHNCGRNREAVVFCFYYTA